MYTKWGSECECISFVRVWNERGLKLCTCVKYEILDEKTIHVRALTQNLTFLHVDSRVYMIHSCTRTHAHTGSPITLIHRRAHTHILTYSGSMHTGRFSLIIFPISFSSWIMNASNWSVSCQQQLQPHISDYFLFKSFLFLSNKVLDIFRHLVLCFFFYFFFVCSNASLSPMHIDGRE